MTRVGPGAENIRYTGTCDDGVQKKDDGIGRRHRRRHRRETPTRREVMLRKTEALMV
jgi:hypothetical protein